MSETTTPRLFDTRLAHFCPGEHCRELCDAESCTCKPCPSWCQFCKARRTAGQRLKGVQRFDIQTDFAHRQPRLFGGPLRGAVNAQDH